MTAAVRTEALTKVHEAAGVTVTALRGVSLDVGAGRSVAVMGPSGSGKSTLLHLLAGLDRPTSGEVTIDGQRLSALDERGLATLRRHKVGVVFQAFNLVPVLTALQNVALPLALSGMRGANGTRQAEEALELVGIADLRDRVPATLSGGEQQRVAIARALVTRPVVLLADEPTGSLDTESSQQVMAALRRAHDELAQTLIIATHDPAVAAAADEVVRLQDGVVAGTLELAGRRASRSAARSVLSWLGTAPSAPSASPAGAG